MILSSSAGLLLKINLSRTAFGVTAWFLLVQGWFLTRATALISYQLTASAAAFCTCRLCPCNRSPSPSHQPDVPRLLLWAVCVCFRDRTTWLLCPNRKSLQDSQILPQDSSNGIDLSCSTLMHPWTFPNSHCYGNNLANLALQNYLQFLSRCQDLPQRLFGGCFALFFHVTFPHPFHVLFILAQLPSLRNDLYHPFAHFAPWPRWPCKSC